VEIVAQVVGPLATNVYVLADPSTREAIAIDTAIPSLALVRGDLEVRGWTLKLIVSTHGHWDHTGDNAALAAHTGAPIAVHPLDAHRLTDPKPLFAPFPIPPSVPAVDLAEGGEIRFGSLRLRVLHTPGHTEGSVCLLAPDDGLMLTGDTLFPGGWGRVDLPGGSAEEMVGSLTRLSRYEDGLAILPGHGPSGVIGDARPWLDEVVRAGSLPA
jgi:glyoxylase-like metal-dependent hydrolase (beta-lactamase superfamily II)